MCLLGAVGMGAVCVHPWIASAARMRCLQLRPQECEEMIGVWLQLVCRLVRETTGDPPAPARCSKSAPAARLPAIGSHFATPCSDSSSLSLASSSVRGPLTAGSRMRAFLPSFWFAGVGALVAKRGGGLWSEMGGRSGGG